jgi:hypothetical protein
MYLNSWTIAKPGGTQGVSQPVWIFSERSKINRSESLRSTSRPAKKFRMSSAVEYPNLVVLKAEHLSLANS